MFYKAGAARPYKRLMLRQCNPYEQFRLM
jgi:hypothetical protein